ncbi:MAG TPA: hypothetical protein VN999_12145 [Thermoanaerobaculia bacterium]|nr:hypothetical protein [Thermoanaerobaculia bacterium]
MPSDVLRARLRQNHARLERRRFAEIFSEKLGIPVESVKFLGLEEHDRLATRFWDRWSKVKSDHSCGSLNELFDTREKVEREIERFCALPDCPAYLLFDHSDDVGAIQVILHYALGKVFSIVEFDGEDFAITNATTSFGLSIEYFWDDSVNPARKVFRVKSWIDDLCSPVPA